MSIDLDGSAHVNTLYAFNEFDEFDHEWLWFVSAQSWTLRNAPAIRPLLMQLLQCGVEIYKKSVATWK